MSYTHPSMHAMNPVDARDTFATPASPDERALFDVLRTITRPSDHSTLTRPGTNSYLPVSDNGANTAPTVMGDLGATEEGLDTIVQTCTADIRSALIGARPTAAKARQFEAMQQRIKDSLRRQRSEFARGLHDDIQRNIQTTRQSPGT